MAGITLGTLTGANTTFMLAVANLYPTPVQIQGFAADDVIETEAASPVETQMGVDGILSAGLVAVPRKHIITLQGDSVSNLVFEAWDAAQQAAAQTGGDLLWASAVLRLPSISRTYIMAKGVLSSVMSSPSVKKLLQPRKYEITWETIAPGPM
jgi:hypothetical protein